MLAQMASVSYASGQAVFRQGDPTDKVYLVAAGELDVGKASHPWRRRADAPQGRNWVGC